MGCKIRFDDHSSDWTYIKMMTDGILLAETQGDPLLSEYNALIIDEAHERSLNIDFLLGYLKGLLAKRTGLTAAYAVEQSIDDYAEWKGAAASLPRVTLDTSRPLGENVDAAFAFLER